LYRLDCIVYNLAIDSTLSLYCGWCRAGAW